MIKDIAKLNLFFLFFLFISGCSSLIQSENKESGQTKKHLSLDKQNSISYENSSSKKFDYENRDDYVDPNLLVKPNENIFKRLNDGFSMPKM